MFHLLIIYLLTKYLKEFIWNLKRKGPLMCHIHFFFKFCLKTVQEMQYNTKPPSPGFAKVFPPTEMGLGHWEDSAVYQTSYAFASYLCTGYKQDKQNNAKTKFCVTSCNCSNSKKKTKNSGSLRLKVFKGFFKGIIICLCTGKWLHKKYRKLKVHS